MYWPDVDAVNRSNYGGGSGQAGSGGGVGGGGGQAGFVINNNGSLVPSGILTKSGSIKPGDK